MWIYPHKRRQLCDLFRGDSSGHQVSRHLVKAKSLAEEVTHILIPTENSTSSCILDLSTVNIFAFCMTRSKYRSRRFLYNPTNRKVPKEAPWLGIDNFQTKRATPCPVQNLFTATYFIRFFVFGSSWPSDLGIQRLNTARAGWFCRPVTTSM